MDDKIPKEDGQTFASTKSLPIEFFLLTVITITVFLASQTMQPILSLYITEKGATTFELGVITSLLSFVAIVAKIPLGILAERVGRWPIIPAVAIGQTVSLLFYSMVPSVSWFYPIRIFHAIILAAFAPTAVSIMLDLAPPRKRGETTGKFLTSIGVAQMLGPFLCTFLVNYVDYVQMFRLIAIIPLLSLIPFLLIRRKGTYNPPDKEGGSNLLVFLKDFASSRNMLVLSYLRLAFSFTNAFFITLFPIYAEVDLFWLPSLIALLFGIKGAANMLSRIPSGRLVDKIGYRRPIFLAFTMLAVTFFVISETGNTYLLIVAMVVYGLGHGMRAVTEWSMLGECAPSRIRSIATAYLSTMFNVGGALGAVAAGALSIIFNIQNIFKIGSVIVFSGALIVFSVKTRVNRREVH